MATRSVCKDAKERLLLSASRHQPIHFPSKLLHRRRNRGTSRVDHNIPFGGYFGQAHPQRFPQPSFHPIPQHGLAESPRHRESQPGPVTLSTPQSPPRHSQAKGRKVPAGESSSLVVGPAEIGGSQDPSS